MKRIDGFNRNIGTFDYQEPVTPDSPYVVDDSSFIPMSEAIKQLGHVNNDGADLGNYYDFPNGKDDGSKVPLTRTSEGKDIAEISSDISNKINNIQDRVDRARDFEEFKKKTDEKMASMRSSTTPPTTE